jgi:surface antigen
MSFPLASLIPGMGDDARVAAKDNKGDKGDITGSLSLQPTVAGSASESMTSVDWSLASSALREALNRKEDAASIPWQNPTTGARGTVTPIAAAYIQDGFACRNFLASHVRNGRESWFEGTACRVHRGEWDVKSTRPLQKS